MTGIEAAGKVATLVTATAAATAMSTNDILLVVVFPMLAAWIGLIGIGIHEEQPTKKIVREIIANFCLGGVAAFVALAVIQITGLSGIPAALISLSCGMGALSIAKKVKASAIKLIDPVLDKVPGLNPDPEVPDERP